MIQPPKPHKIANSILWHTRHTPPLDWQKIPNGMVKPHHILREVFSNRAHYKKAIEELKTIGFIDPFEITNDIYQYANQR